MGQGPKLCPKGPGPKGTQRGQPQNEAKRARAKKNPKGSGPKLGSKGLGQKGPKGSGPKLGPKGPGQKGPGPKLGPKGPGQKGPLHSTTSDKTNLENIAKSIPFFVRHVARFLLTYFGAGKLFNSFVRVGSAF